MHIVEKSMIRRTAAQVWPFIISSEHFQKWNSKVVSIEAKGEFVLGQQFTTHYRMSGKEMQCISMATAIQPCRLLELKHAHCIGSNISRDLVVYERISLEEKDGGTLVTKDVEVLNHGIPWILLPLIWFVTRSGKPKEPDRLKQLCEETGPLTGRD